ncbi:MAG: hypothetical protein KDD69_16155, partial [Bdellovibrionales bacterium]|nr:hypothetical protein [Bdellovibrionales bacterium]
MASSLHSYEPHAETTELPELRPRNFEKQPMPRWELRIAIGQVVILWAVLAGMMVMVFLFGFHAGREQGLSR